MAQLNSGLGASDSLFSHVRSNDVKRSRFDLSRIIDFTPDAGQIIPFDTFPTLPGDDFTLNFDMVMETMPLINSSYTQYKVLVHYYYMRNSDLWKGWNTFVTRGRSGNVELTVPRISVDDWIKFHDYAEVVTLSSSNPFDEIDDASVNFSFSANSLASYIDGSGGSRVGSSFDVIINPEDDDDVSVVVTDFYSPYVFSFTGDPRWVRRLGFTARRPTGNYSYNNPSALPYMMYQSIVKNNYVDQNLLQNNKALFPVEGDADWLLPYDASVTNYVGVSSNLGAVFSDGSTDPIFSYDGVYSDNDNCVRLDQLRYAMFDDDYFTSALPWLQRGDVVSLPLGSFDSTVDFSNVVDDGNDGSFFSSVQLAYFERRGYGLRGDSLEATGHLLNVLNSAKVSATASASLTANQFRELIALSVWQERNARVDGSYNRMIKVHWDQNPHSQEHLPIYIGGAAQYLQFSTVVASSASEDAPLGATAGRATASGKSFIGKFHSPDYGFIMGVMIIKPVTTYSQGLEHFAFETSWDDFVQPEFESLSPQPILNKELYISENRSDLDNGLFAYQERYTYLKVRHNVARGLFGLNPSFDNYFGSMLQSRWFDSLPKFSYQFRVMSKWNMRRDFLAYPAYPMFRCQVASGVDVVRSLAYSSQPNTFGF